MDKTLNDFRVEGVLGKAVAVGGSSVLFISRPDTDEFCSRNDRRYWFPMLVAHGDRRHSLRGWPIPLRSYLDEVSVRCLAMKISEPFVGERLIRKSVERTLHRKFINGQRGFHQWLLKHQAWTRRAPTGGNDLRKDQRGKIKEPSIHFHPAMEVFLPDGNRLPYGIGKRDQPRAA